jgi:hypothetical protein
MKATIPYLEGYVVKPYTTDLVGVVTFTDGTNIAIQPNQQQCEAYGYTYDKTSGTCSAFTFSTNLGTSLTNENNKVSGANNVTETGTNNTYVMGEGNTVRGLARNNIIIGSNNEISNGINNASVFGNYGIAQRQGEIVIGGGGFSGAGVGKAQSSIITLTGTTRSATPANLFVNGDINVTAIPRSGTGAFESFEVMIIGVRTGGSAGSGAVNDRKAIKTYGMIYLDVVDQTTYKIGEFGTITGWAGEAAFAGGNMYIEVTGAADMDISWSATLNIYEIKI